MARKQFAIVNGSEEEVLLERTTPRDAWTLAGEGPVDLVRTGSMEYSLVRNGRSHRVFVLKEDRDNGTVRLRIGGGVHTVRLQDEQSRLMKTLGLDRVVPKVREIKAPMPGLVINILVKPGDVVKKDDPVLVLEAMKMENVIRAPGDAVVSAIPAGQGKAVEKGQLLVSFV